MKYRVGEWVEVRDKEKILATLDRSGRLGGLPFMPQMFQYCGQQFQIYKRAHKSCDTVSGRFIGISLSNMVHLERRCDGQAFGGCQAECLIFWHESWLKPVDGEASAIQFMAPEPSDDNYAPGRPVCTVEDVLRATTDRSRAEGQAIKYRCQATELLDYSTPMPWWDVRQYVEDYRSGNVSLAQVLSSILYFGFVYLSLARNERFGGPGRWLYDKVQKYRGGTPFPKRRGTLPKGWHYPITPIDLRPGELVRVKSYQKILETMDSTLQDRGLYWSGEMVPYCGRVSRVHSRVEKFIDERTGLMKRLKTPAVILEGFFCQSLYCRARLLCPRSVFVWWREIWLERVPENLADQASTAENTPEPKPLCVGEDSLASNEEAQRARV